MGTKQKVGIAVVNDKTTGERKVAIGSAESDMLLVFNLEELKALHTGIIDAIAYMEKHGNNTTESVPEGTVRH